MKYPLILIFIATFFSINAQENNAFTCGDGIDNDGDGLIDCLDPDCDNLLIAACNICDVGLTFADTLLDYQPGCPLVDPQPIGAVGVGDYEGGFVDGPDFVFLGNEGSIKLGFLNNLLGNSGDEQVDMYVFEIGQIVESTHIALRPWNNGIANLLIMNGVPDVDGDGYFEMGTIAGSTNGVDIDAFLPGFAMGELIFDAIELTDAGNGCGTETPGADIDAVCALFSIELDCAGVINGLSVYDECGVCLLPDDPAFNQSCADCEGVPNGSAVVDDCGICLQPDSPDFNSCADCAGVIFGNSVIDSCGQCLLVFDANFNNCLDCAGTPNGTAVIDFCGECWEVTAPQFNQSCVANNIVYFPNVFSPNSDGINDVFQGFADPIIVREVKSFQVFDRWGSLIFENSNFDFYDATQWWDGRLSTKKPSVEVYTFFAEIEFQTEHINLFKGDVLLMR